jgi:creatinine amidohydrolase
MGRQGREDEVDEMTERARRLGELTSAELAALLEGEAPVVALVPVGSVEPHGPHLPLLTDAFISEAAVDLAARQLAEDGLCVLIAPTVPFGVTDYAGGFAGAVSIPGDVLSAYLRAVVTGLLDQRFAHVCLVNNHLEPEHDGAVRAAIEGTAPSAASVACPLARRWGRTLTAEYKSGACHAGRYETSIVLAARPALVRTEEAARLPPVEVSLSEAIRAGKTRFAAMGLDQAYAGAPAEATREEGEDTLAKLATMIATEVREGLGERGRPLR